MSLKPFLEFNFEEKENRLYLANFFVYLYSLSLGKNIESTYVYLDLHRANQLLNNRTTYNIIEVLELPFKEIIFAVNMPAYKIYFDYIHLLFLLFYLFDRPLKLKIDKPYYLFVNNPYNIHVNFKGNASYAYKLYNSEQWKRENLKHLIYMHHYISFKISNNNLILL